jgi:hypothetical protein
MFDDAAYQFLRLIHIYLNNKLIFEFDGSFFPLLLSVAHYNGYEEGGNIKATHIFALILLGRLDENLIASLETLLET